ncbi:MAG: hypothetical protein NVS1B4_00360 [Gemmatimonadaceae bacterium]
MKNGTKFALVAVALGTLAVPAFMAAQQPTAAEKKESNDLKKVGGNISKTTKKAGRDVNRAAIKGGKDTNREAVRAGKNTEKETQRVKRRVVGTEPKP